MADSSLLSTSESSSQRTAYDDFVGICNAYVDANGPAVIPTDTGFTEASTPAATQTSSQAPTTRILTTATANTNAATPFVTNTATFAAPTVTPTTTPSGANTLRVVGLEMALAASILFFII
ncbi:hypothetical protein P7C70_g8122, partial [Phenoliferia sp. Uapishka_3]